jgi:hypothetical protein
LLSVIADTLTQAGTAARWERRGIGAQELAMHLLDTSAGVKSATENLSNYKQRMALAGKRDRIAIKFPDAHE